MLKEGIFSKKRYSQK